MAAILLITPPFTQLNTPYPATAYLKGFLNTRNISSFQCDLGIEAIHRIFSRNGLEAIFLLAERSDQLDENGARILALKEDYLVTIEPVMHFLSGKDTTLAYQIAAGGYLPEASRFEQSEDLDWAFGNMGVQDKAKHLATLYLEDLADLIKTCIDPHFGFSRYAEHLGRSANSFDELYTSLHLPLTFTDTILIELLKNKIDQHPPELVAISVPFPGNLYAAFRCAQFIKQQYPKIKIAMGGGFVNTELRSLSDARVFEFFDFISLDDGEAPLEKMVQFVRGDISENEMKRTFILEYGSVVLKNDATCRDYASSETGVPDYADLFLDKYIAAIEVLNPMHSLWSNGRWNKLTMAHGCYWGKCTFCDITLPYIQDYAPLTAAEICDKMEVLIEGTGQTGFHFVDEAAPPALMREVALEILRRKLQVTWWTNIRFEKSFTRDLCLLLKASGCIAVSGGLEVASDRLLALIDKGVTVEQVTKVNRNFTDAGIMVHAYLMYGFPTQTIQETIDSLEMVRQLFENDVLQSAFWHQFAMTAHSPVGREPEKFRVKKISEAIGAFANNDIDFTDATGIDHQQFSEGLRISLLNYMQGAGLDLPLQDWFEMEIPETTIPPDHISDILSEKESLQIKANARVIYLGALPQIHFFNKTKKGISYEMAELTFHTRNGMQQIELPRNKAIWLAAVLETISVHRKKISAVTEIKENYLASGLEDFELFWHNKPVSELWQSGLLQV